MSKEELKDELIDLLDGLGNVQTTFTKKLYPGEYEQFSRKAQPFLLSLEAEYEACPEEEKDEFTDFLANGLADAVAERVNALPRRKQELEQMQYNLAMVTYIDPVLLDLKGTVSEPLTDKIIAAWEKHFPKMKIQKADYNTIVSGFKRKLCYITTAVCQHLDKGDDCEELMTLRLYRDSYLENSEDGRALVERYYDLAPTIVNRINRREDADDIYEQIYSEYLQPCLKDIEDGAYETCKERYQTMVEALYQAFVTA